MYTKELFPVEDGFGYRVLKDGTLVVVQDYQPGVEGFQVMSKTKAGQLANELVEYYQSLTEVSEP